MLPVPVSYYADYTILTKKTRPIFFHEYAANGAKHLALTSSFLGAITQDPSLMATLKKELSDEGLSFLDSHAISNHNDFELNTEEPLKRRYMISRHKLSFWIAAEMGVDTMAFHSGFDFVLKDFSIAKQIDLVSDALEELLPEAEKAGITMCLENIWFSGCMPDVLLTLKKRFPTPNLAFCYDSGHAHIISSAAKVQEGGWARADWKRSGYKEPLWEDDALEKMLPFLVNCHLHDNNGLSDEHSIPGKGTIDWKKIISLLRKAPHLRVIQSEVPPSAIQSISEITKAFSALEGL